MPEAGAIVQLNSLLKPLGQSPDKRGLCSPAALTALGSSRICQGAEEDTGEMREKKEKGKMKGEV